MTPTDDETRRQLEAAKLRAAETANALKRAPRAQYPGASAAPPQQGMPPPVDASRASAWSDAQAEAAPLQIADVVPPAAAPAKPASGTPHIDTLLARSKQAADRATADAGRNVDDMAAQRKRRERLRGELMQASLKLANPNASPLELDMARRRR